MNTHESNFQSVLPLISKEIVNIFLIHFYMSGNSVETIEKNEQIVLQPGVKLQSTSSPNLNFTPNRRGLSMYVGEQEDYRKWFRISFRNVCLAILCCEGSVCCLHQFQWAIAAKRKVISVEMRLDRVTNEPLQPSSAQQKVLAPQSSEKQRKSR